MAAGGDVKTQRGTSAHTPSAGVKAGLSWCIAVACFSERFVTDPLSLMPKSLDFLDPLEGSGSPSLSSASLSSGVLFPVWFYCSPLISAPPGVGLGPWGVKRVCLPGAVRTELGSQGWRFFRGIVCT